MRGVRQEDPRNAVGCHPLHGCVRAVRGDPGAAARRRRVAMADEPQGKNWPPEISRMLLGMVALNRPALPAPQEMLETLAALSGTSVKAQTIEATQRTLAFSLGDNRAAVALMPAPIPWQNLEGPCETAWWWPEAAARMHGHNSHLLVALGGDGGDIVGRSVALTHLIAAVAAHVDAAG